MDTQNTTMLCRKNNSFAIVNGEGTLKSRFNFTKLILFILIAFSTLLLFSGSAMAVGYMNTGHASAGGATPINTIEDLHDIRNNLNGNYILMSDLDFTSLTVGSAYEQSLGWKVTAKAVAISGSNDVTFELTANAGSLAASTVQYSFGKETGTATLIGGQFTVPGTASDYDGVTPMTLLIGGTNTGAPAGEQDFATYLEVTTQGDTRTSYHLGNFKPIGSRATPFTGTFNGNNYEIKGIETATFYGGSTNKDIHTGMFAYISGATVKNVVTKGGSAITASINYIDTIPAYPPPGPERAEYFFTHGTGIIVGLSYVNSVVDNCFNNGTSVSKYYAAGIVGNNYASTISNSTNSGNMTTTERGSGGIVGHNHVAATVSNSTNSGTMTAIDNNAGGIAGYNLDASTISDSTNSGTVKSKNDSAGGIVGYNSLNNSTVSNSTNSGTITATGIAAGGIAGYNENNAKISGSSNSGTIKADIYAGGIAGYNNRSSTVSSSTNSGTVTAISNNAGGIVGTNQNSTVFSSVNLLSGAITSTIRAGGIVGNNVASTVSDSMNFGDVTATSNNAGGIVGQSDQSTVSNSTNSGNVSSSGAVGGIVGYNYNNSAVSNSMNSGNVTTTSNHAGGIVGYNNISTVSSSMNSGNVTATGDYAGGITGTNFGSISMSLNEGIIRANNYAGGIAGQFNSTGVTAAIDITNCYNRGLVTATTNNAGGIVGQMIKGTENVKINSTYNSAMVTAVGGSAVGGIVGLFSTATSADVTNSYYINTITGGTAAGAATPDADLKLQATFIGWDFINTWVIGPANVNGGYPYFESFVNMIIKTQPSRQNIFDGDRATFFIEMLKGAPYTYQWQISTDGGTTWINAPGISTTSTYVTDSLSYGSTAQFRCVVTSLVDPTKTSTSNAGTVDVKYASSGSSGGNNKGSGVIISGNNTSTPPVDDPGLTNPGSTNPGPTNPGPTNPGPTAPSGNESPDKPKTSIWWYVGIIALVVVIAAVVVYFVKFRGNDY